MAATGTNLNTAKALLTAGKLVAIPTETVYGLAANALNINAVRDVFTVKQRPAFDPLILHIAPGNNLEKYALSVPEKAKKLADKFWPGPLTLVLKKRNNIHDLITSGLDTVGLRCPFHPLTSALLAQLPFPLVAPSANPFGYISPTSPKHVDAQLGTKIPYILDGGESIIGIESTILGFERNRPTLYRLGGINQEEIEKVIGTVAVSTHSTSNPTTPGQLERHYAPQKKIIIGDIDILVQHFDARHVGALCFQHYTPLIPPAHTVVLSPSGNLNEAARKLFSSLRQLDQMDIKVILVEKIPHVGIGKAINDRLARAATSFVP